MDSIGYCIEKAIISSELLPLLRDAVLINNNVTCFKLLISAEFHNFNFFSNSSSMFVHKKYSNIICVFRLINITGASDKNRPLRTC